MIALRARVGRPDARHAALVGQILFEDKELFKRQLEDVRRMAGVLPPSVDAGAFKAKRGQTLLLHPGGTVSHQILLIGGGTVASFSLETARRASAAAVKAAAWQHARTVAIIAPDLPELSDSAYVKSGGTPYDLAMALAEGGALAAYRFDKYRTRAAGEFPGVGSFSVVVPSRKHLRTATKGVRDAAIVCGATWFARDLANAPGNEIYPATLAQRARLAGRRYGFSVRVFDEKKIARLKMGGLLGVARGSRNAPRFIIAEYAPRGRRVWKPTVVLVGKGITFDSGGISIKPSANMAEMKMDMSGAAAVLGIMQAAAQLHVPVHLIGLIPAAENLPGGNALKPGDILRHYNGKTSEVDNTDAEGRLILADALAYAGRYKPDLLLDLATLTGAVVVALGHVATGMMGTSTTAMQQLSKAGERTYERVWELPLFEEYEKLIKSDIADVKNVGGRWAGTITGALFLKQFINAFPWVHLDIAGTAILEEAGEYCPRGASGVGVRLLIDFLQHYKP
ncbi:MAG TPA: leucyl aminopeptidase [Bacteroidota bacterium]|nr:leucyl aminopeptidase [Bacteroidota bacterium]